MGLRARKCKPSLGKVTKKLGLLKGTGEKTMSPSSKFLAITICHLNNALEHKPPSFKPLPPLKYLRFDPESLPSLVCSMGCAWDLRISALQCSNIPAFSLRAQVGRRIVAAPWLSTFVMSKCACSCTRSHTTPELAPTKVWRWFLGASGVHWLPYGYIASHTDAAKTYKMHIPGVVHDNVIHAKKRVKINGKWRWQNPSYVRIVTHKVPGVKKPIKCKAGTVRRSLTELGSFWRIASLLTRIAKLVLQLSVPSWGPPSRSTGTRTTTFGWQPVCSAPGKWSNSSSVPENVIASPSVSKALLPALHIHLSSVQTKKLGDNHQKPPVHSMFVHWSFINVFRKTTC